MGCTIVDFKSARIFKLDGILNTNVSDQLFDFFKDNLNIQNEHIGIDFKSVDFIDSSGIGSLVRCVQTAMGLNKKLFLYSVSQDIKEIFEVTGLTRFFNILDDASLKREYPDLLRSGSSLDLGSLKQEILAEKDGYAAIKIGKSISFDSDEQTADTKPLAPQMPKVNQASLPEDSPDDKAMDDVDSSEEVAEERFEINFSYNDIWEFENTLYQLCKRFGFSDGEIFYTKFSVDDAIINIIKIELRENRLPKITIALKVVNNDLIISVHNMATPVDQTKLAQLKIPNPSKVGQGVHLMQSFMDKVEFNKADDRGNSSLILTKHIK